MIEAFTKFILRFPSGLNTVKVLTLSALELRLWTFVTISVPYPTHQCARGFLHSYSIDYVYWKKQPIISPAFLLLLFTKIWSGVRLVLNYLLLSNNYSSYLCERKISRPLKVSDNQHMFSSWHTLLERIRNSWQQFPLLVISEN